MADHARGIGDPVEDQEKRYQPGPTASEKMEMWTVMSEPEFVLACPRVNLGDPAVYTERSVDDDILLQYRFSREQLMKGNRALAEHYYQRNREKHAIDIFYEVELPEHVVFVHPIGSVLGRATYSDYLVCYQNVGVGSSLDNERAVLGRGVALMPGCKVIGPTIIGDNVFVLANAVMNGCTVPSNSIAYGYNQWQPTERSVVERFFK